MEEAMDSSDDLWRSVWDFWNEKKKYIISSWEDGERGGEKPCLRSKISPVKSPKQ